MTQVNPPGFLRKIIPRDQYTEEQLNFLDNLVRSFEQLYRRTGGTTDAIVDTDIGFGGYIDFDELMQNLGQPNGIIEEPTIYTVTSSHTTSGDERLEITAQSAITLNPNADDDESVSVYINGGVYSTVTDGTETDTFVEDGLYMTYTYSADAGEWVRGS